MWFDTLGGVTHIGGLIYRSPMPQTPHHVRDISSHGIRTVYSMEWSVPGQLFADAGLRWKPHFWTDDTPPSYAEMDKFLADARQETEPYLVHCKAGWGRTGSAICCKLIDEGWSASKALEYYWSRVPAARNVMRGNGQAEFVRGFEARVKGRGL